MPLFVEREDGTEGIIRRQCTREYKVAPIRRKIVELLGGKRPAGAVDLLIGITVDEAHRMRSSDVRYISNVYPLIDLRLYRSDCARWLADRGYEHPARSACIGCPYHDDRDWRRFQNEQSEVWRDAVSFDHAIRNQLSNRGNWRGEKVYLHRTLRPLDLADLRTAEDLGQLSLFGSECEGLCGV